MTKYRIALKETYLAMIKNAVGTNMFRNFYLIKDGKKNDDTQDGRLSCAFFASNILHFFKLIKAPHLTVSGLQKDMEKSGWQKISRPREGAVLFWEEKYGHGSRNRHVGFYVGGNHAISNMSKSKRPGQHHFTYGHTRKIEAIYWHEKLEQEGKKIDS